MIFSVFWLNYPMTWAKLFKALWSTSQQREHITRDRVSTRIRLFLIQFMGDPVIPLLLLTCSRGISLWNCQRMIPDKGEPAGACKKRRYPGISALPQSYQLGKGGNRAPGSRGQSVLTDVSGTKILFQQLYCHYSNRAGGMVPICCYQDCKALRDNQGPLREGTCARTGSAVTDCWWAWERLFPSKTSEIALERKRFSRERRSSATRMIHWCWICEFISFNMPRVWRDCMGPDLFYKRRIREKNLHFSTASARDEWKLVDL